MGNKTRIKGHPRYREVRGFPICWEDECPYKMGDLRVVIFINDKKLREHVVKHILSSHEDWPKVCEVDEQNLVQAWAGLRDIGCPYVSCDISGNPPCSSCTIEACSSILGLAETEYVKCIERVMEEMMNAPMYVCYAERTEYNHILVGMYRKAVVKLHITKRSNSSDDSSLFYNVLTAYVRGEKKEGDAIKKEIERVKAEGRRGTMLWCNEESWRIADNGDARVNEKAQRTKAKGRPKRFVRCRRMHWRDWLMEYYDQVE